MRRVVVTGMGVVSALGNSVAASWERLHQYKNAIVMLEDLTKYKGLHTNLACPITDFTPPSRYTRKVIRTMGPISIMSLYATEQALEQAGLIDIDNKTQHDVIKNGRTGVAYGSSFGSVDPVLDFFSMIKTNELGNITSSTYIKMMPQTTAVNLSVHFGTTGRLIPSGTACTSGSLSIGYAYESIKFGLQDVMIAGGAEEFSPTQIAVFDTLYATSTKNDNPELSPAPFDKNRDGLVIGEGAGTLVLEEYEHAKARGATILAEIVGFATNTDGSHVTQANPITIAKCLENALKDANLTAADIGYINAHGTATKIGDEAETKATASIFGENTPISSLKSYTGHTLGACGVLESVWTIQMMRNNWFAPTLNLTDPDPACGKLDFIMGEARKIEVQYAMNNNFAFGGINTSIIFKKYSYNM